VYCPYGPGLSETHVSACSDNCEAAKPSYTGAPECETAAEECQPLCEQAVAYLDLDCARCLIDNIYWPPGGCGSWECFCPPPEFPAASIPACSDICE
jgi:hypothetical protein